MKTLTKLALALAFITAAVTAPAQYVRGYIRSNGSYVAPHYRSGSSSYGGSSSSSYTYRNPYAAYPSVSVDGYYRSSGSYVAPHVRTPANGTLTDNLGYRGFGSVRVPRY